MTSNDKIDANNLFNIACKVCTFMSFSNCLDLLGHSNTLKNNEYFNVVKHHVTKIRVLWLFRCYPKESCDTNEVFSEAAGYRVYDTGTDSWQMLNSSALGLRM